MIKALRTICLIAGLLLIAAALCLIAWNVWQTRCADESSALALTELTEGIAERQEKQEQETTRTVANGEVVTRPLYETTPQIEMPLITIDGRDYIGTLSVPSLDLELPVLSEWDYPGLRIAPCRYYGSAYTDSLIIAAHNYQSHFGRLKELNEGDEILFTDADGNVFVYRVAVVEILEPQAIDEMLEGDWPLTLFTCTLGGKSRVTVRCDRAD